MRWLLGGGGVRGDADAAGEEVLHEAGFYKAKLLEKAIFFINSAD
jgi:hypothetical protein